MTPRLLRDPNRAGHKKGAGHKNAADHKNVAGRESVAGHKKEVGYKNVAGHKSEVGLKNAAGHKSVPGHKNEADHKNVPGRKNEAGHMNVPGHNLDVIATKMVDANEFYYLFTSYLLAARLFIYLKGCLKVSRIYDMLNWFHEAHLDSIVSAFIPGGAWDKKRDDRQIEEYLASAG